MPPTALASPSLLFRHHEHLHHSAPRFRRVPQAPLHCSFLPWQYHYNCALAPPPALPLLCPTPFPPRTLQTCTSANRHDTQVKIYSPGYIEQCAAETLLCPGMFLLPRLAYSPRAGGDLHRQTLPKMRRGLRRRRATASGNHARASSGGDWGAMARYQRKNWKKRGGKRC